MPLTTYDQALQQLLDALTPLGTETVSLEAATGRTLATPIVADRDLPPFHRSAMDGYAVRLDEIQLGQPYPVVGTIAAGASPPPEEGLRATGLVRIATGASVPPEYDAVIPIEKAEPSADGQSVVFTDTVRPGFAVHPRGADAKTGDTLIPAGTTITPHHVGIAASAGVTDITVARQPRVVVLSTGDELLPPETATAALAPQQIRNSNGPMLTALATAAGAHIIRHDHLVDELDATIDGARRAIQDADLVLTSGGVSVGDRDHLPNAWQSLGTETLLHGVAIQPGKPVLIAQAKTHQAIILGLPGNPVSVLATFHLFARPAVRAYLGQDPALPWRQVTLADAVRSKPQRELFRAVTVDAHNIATLLPWQGSGDLAHTAPMHGFIRLPQQGDEVPAGTAVDFLPV